MRQFVRFIVTPKQARRIIQTLRTAPDLANTGQQDLDLMTELQTQLDEQS